MKKCPYPKYKTSKSKYDDSTLTSDNTFRLDDGRPVTAMMWSECGYTFLTYLFSVIDIEDIKKEEIENYLIKQGIKLNSKYRGSILKVTDCEGNEFWNYTLTIGEEE